MHELIRQAVERQLEIQDVVCAVALLDGRFGVSVNGSRAWIDPEVPYGELHYHQLDPSPSVRWFTADTTRPPGGNPVHEFDCVKVFIHAGERTAETDQHAEEIARHRLMDAHPNAQDVRITWVHHNQPDQWLVFATGKDTSP